MQSHQYSAAANHFRGQAFKHVGLSHGEDTANVNKRSQRDDGEKDRALSVPTVSMIHFAVSG